MEGYSGTKRNQAGTLRVRGANPEKVNLNWLLLKLYGKYRIEASMKGVNLVMDDMLEKKNSDIETDVFRLNHDLKYVIGSVVRYTTEGRINMGLRLKGNKIEFYIASPGNGSTRDYQDIVSGLSNSSADEDNDSDLIPGKGEGPLLLKIKVEKKEGYVTLVSDPEKGSEICFSIPDIRSRDLLR